MVNFSHEKGILRELKSKEERGEVIGIYFYHHCNGHNIRHAGVYYMRVNVTLYS